MSANEVKKAAQEIKPKADTAQSTTSTNTSQQEPSFHSSEANPAQSRGVQTRLEDQASYEAYDQALEVSCRQGALEAARRLNSQLRARKTPSPAPSTMEHSSPVESADTEVERLFYESESREKREQVAVLQSRENRE